jgi:signal transduction histidine kinase
MAFDAAIAVILGTAAGLSLYIATDPALTQEFADYPLGVAVTALTVLHLAVLLRRRFPVATLLVGAAAYFPLPLADIPEGQVSPVSLFILLYTAGAYGGRRRELARRIVSIAIVALVLWAVLREPPVPFEGRVPIQLVNLFVAAANLYYLVAALLLGNLVRNRRAREATLEAQTAALAAAQQDLARRAVLDERVRIARELHDVLAHHVSLMGVQAGAARRVLSSNADAVPDLLGSIEGSSREALVELQRLLGLLRQDEEDAAIGGQPRLDRLPELAAQMREAGLDVEIAVEHGPPLPAGVELSAYRIVQEALTNTLKHAGPGARAQVELRRSASALELAITDDGKGAEGRAVGAPGHGLVGMRERVNLLGGELRVGRRSGGGFEVRAWFPLAGAVGGGS